MTESDVKRLVRVEGDRAFVLAGDYLNKLAGEKIERECREYLADGCREIVINFSQTEIVNSIGVSILLGLIDTAKGAGARVIFSSLNRHTVELFEMLGIMNHVTVQE